MRPFVARMGIFEMINSQTPLLFGDIRCSWVNPNRVLRLRKKYQGKQGWSICSVTFEESNFGITIGNIPFLSIWKKIGKMETKNCLTRLLSKNIIIIVCYFCTEFNLGNRIFSLFLSRSLCFLAPLSHTRSFFLVSPFLLSYALSLSPP